MKTFKALLHVSRFNVFLSPLCGLGIHVGLAARCVLMRFRCFYTVFASLQVETDFAVNLCDKHVTKVANWNNGIIRDVLLFDFDVVLAMISTMLPQLQMLRPFFDNITDAATDAADAAILRQYRQCCRRRRRCYHSLTISTMLLQMLLLFFFGRLYNDVILPPFNHLVASICLKPCITGGLGLLRIDAR